MTAAATTGKGMNGGLTPMIACSQPGETHAERDDDRGQIAQIDERAERGVERYATHQRQRAEPRLVAQPGRRYAADKADESADRQIEVVARDDERLRHRGERDRDRKIQHQGEAE